MVIVQSQTAVSWMTFRVQAIFLFSTLWLIAACAGTPLTGQTGGDKEELVIFAAASLTEALTAVGERFSQEHPNSRLLFNFAGSQQLAGQLAQGAQADLFLSADARQMDAAVTEGRIDAGSVRTFACNRLVAVVSDRAIESVQDLARPGLKIVVGAEAVPVGAYTRQFLQAASADPLFPPNFEADVMKNVVSYEQSVRAVLGKVRLGEADAGIVYASDVDASDAAGAEDIRVLAIPAAVNPTALYPVGVVQGAKSVQTAQQFVDFLLSAPAKETLSTFGFSFECLPAAP